MAQSTAVTFARRAGHREEISRPIPPWGRGPAPERVRKSWEQLVAWMARDDLTSIDIVNMLREAGAPACQPEQVGILRGVIGYYVSARANAARHATKPKGGRPPFERIAAAVAELRRSIPEEVKTLEGEMSGRPDNLLPPTSGKLLDCGAYWRPHPKRTGLRGFRMRMLTH